MNKKDVEKVGIISFAVNVEGDRSVGIFPIHEDVAICLRYTEQKDIDQDTIEAFREGLKLTYEILGGGFKVSVLTEDEYNEQIKKELEWEEKYLNQERENK